MIEPQKQYEKVITLLDNSEVEYKLFEHRAAFTYEELAAVQKETGFFGTEMKCLVMKADEDFIIYITLQGNKIEFSAVKETTQSKKVRLATSEELKEYFRAEPGCAYPFGFDESVTIFIDPAIYNQEWLLFSPVLPTRTVQVKGGQLKVLFDSLPNENIETLTFNKDE